MAKTVGPLLSFSASGQIGNAMVFGTWRGVQYSRRYVIPANPNTASQQTQRSSFATLRELWKRIDADARAPWDAYAAGRKFIGVNAFIGENRLSIGIDALMTAFVGSPGARGGIPLVDMVAVGGALSGEIDIDFTVPAVPTGWTITDTVALLFPDQAPSAVFPGGAVTSKISVAPWDHSVSGLVAGDSYIVAGWAVMTKPDGSVAYSPSITDTVTATV